MKIKALLFAVVVAGMGLTANAATQYINCTDRLVAENITIDPSVSLKATVEVYLHRNGTPDLTNIQGDIVFPIGIRPRTNAAGAYTASGNDVKTTVEEDGETMTVTHVVFSDNFGRTDFYPNHRFVGVNNQKHAITVNPAHILRMYIVADEDLPAGSYDIMYHTLKYTSYNNDSYASWYPERGEEPQKLCTITIDGHSGVNDLNVETAKTYKTIEDGQVVIVKDGVKYNTMGQIIK